MFDLTRFARLARAQWAEQYRSYAWFLGIGVIVHFVLLLVLLPGRSGFMALSTNGQASIYFAGLFLTAPIFAARYFQAMARRESAGVLLMRPASGFEKWLLAVLIVAVLYPVAYSVAFNLCNIPAGLIAQARAADALAALPPDEIHFRLEQLRPEKFQLFLPWHWLDKAREVAETLLMLGFLQAFAMLGSLYFRTTPFIKTVLAGFLLLLASILALSLAEFRSESVFLDYWSTDTPPVGWQAWFVPMAWFLVPGLLWLACLFALREREVA